MTWSPSATSLWLRFSAIGVGILTLLWLPIEDTNELAAIFIALLISGLLALRALLGHQHHQSLLRFTLIGGLAGAATIPIALLLLAFKTGLHSHGAPDFPADQIIAVLRRTPFFTTGGLLLGLGSGTWNISRRS